jgi:hypothetical protein
MSIVLVGSTSGSVTLQEPAVAGSTVLDLPAVSGTIITTGSSGQSIPKAALPTGSVLQVVQGTTTTQVSTTGITLVDTGLTATITPTSASSKILVLVEQSSCGKENNERLRLVLLRNSTQICNIIQLGGYTNSTAPNNIGSVSTSFLDSPATTSATTYKTQFSCINGVGEAFVQWNPSLSTITLMEIAA